MTWTPDPVRTSPTRWVGYDAAGKRVAFIATCPEGWLWHAERPDGTDKAAFSASETAAKREATAWLERCERGSEALTPTVR
jgi:hypothetical protein